MQEWWSVLKENYHNVILLHFKGTVYHHEILVSFILTFKFHKYSRESCINFWSIYYTCITSNNRPLLNFSLIQCALTVCVLKVCTVVLTIPEIFFVDYETKAFKLCNFFGCQWTLYSTNRCSVIVTFELKILFKERFIGNICKVTML